MKSSPKNKNPQVPEWTRDSGKIIVVPVELPPAAHAVLSGFGLMLGHDSVAAYILDLVKQELRGFALALSDEETDMIEGLLGLEGKGVEA